MFVPLSTNAPIYHFPWATLGLVAASVTSFAMTGFGDFDEHPAWILQYGDGLHPLQWFTSCLFHFDALHLAGNMFFLWAFGLVVEGKTGWTRFLAIYFGIAAAHGFVEQLLMSAATTAAATPTGSAGASGVVYGLMAMAVVWAPRNELNCVLFHRFFFGRSARTAPFDVTILTFSGFYVAMELLTGSFGGFSMGSVVIHLLDVVVGFGLAVVMLRRDIVDCENWDLFAVLAGTYGNDDHNSYLYREGPVLNSTAGRPATRRDADAEDRVAMNKSELLQKVSTLLNLGKPRAACRVWRQLHHFALDTSLDAEMRSALIDGLYRAGAWSEVEPLLVSHIQSSPQDETVMRLRLARLQIEIQKRPRAGLKVLGAIDANAIDDVLRDQLSALRRSADRLVEEGVLELEGRAW